MSRIGLTVSAVLFAALLGVPWWLRPPEEAPPSGAVTVLALSPHPEEVRYEMARAFTEWHRRRYPADPPVVIEFRNVGGTSDIIRYIRSEFAGAFAASYGPTPGDQWAGESDLRKLEQSAKTDGEKSRVAALRKARSASLAGDVGIGIDVFFGGGDFESTRLADAGYLVPVALPADVMEGLPPEVAAGKPWTLAGNPLADPVADKAGGRRWWGTCLSAFGIVYSPGWHRANGVPEPRRWADLARPEYFNRTAAADPSKSGSAMKCFEMILQQEMQEAGGDLAEGWLRGMDIIAKLSANARYLADSAPKVPLDVSLGEAAAGMTIDFYGRYQELAAGADRIAYRHPEGGTAFSADPVSVLRGAPNRKYAERFVAFCLSREGQMVWNLPPRTGPHGTDAAPDGTPIPPELLRPRKYALRRTPVRPDLYGLPEYRRLAMDRYDPFSAGPMLLRYDAKRTGALFGLLKDYYLPAMMVDAREEMTDAWRATIAVKDPTKRMLMSEAFGRPLLTWKELNDVSAELKTAPRYAEAAGARREEWCRRFQERFRAMAESARAE